MVGKITSSVVYPTVKMRSSLQYHSLDRSNILSAQILYDKKFSKPPFWCIVYEAERQGQNIFFSKTSKKVEITIFRVLFLAYIIFWKWPFVCQNNVLFSKGHNVTLPQIYSLHSIWDWSVVHFFGTPPPLCFDCEALWKSGHFSPILRHWVRENFSYPKLWNGERLKLDYLFFAMDRIQSKSFFIV